MSVSVEVLDGLERKLTISIPSEKIETEVDARLKKHARQVKIAGYRPGKAPQSEVRRRYSDSIREEVSRELIQPTLAEAFQSKEIVPAGYPVIDLGEIREGQDFTYSAKFEIYPEIQLKDLDKQIKLSLIEGEITEKDVDETLQKLQAQHKKWTEVQRPAALGDKLDIDFCGYINDEPFSGGKASHHEIELGSGSMIPGFEAAIVGHSTGETFDIMVTFPENYHHKDMSGKAARFEITIHKISEGELPNLDDAFAEKFDVKEGGMTALREDIEKNLKRDLMRRVSSKNRDVIFDAFIEVNPITLPKSLVDREIEALKHELFHRVFGEQHHDNEKIPDFPRELFEKKAIRRVHLGLLFSEFVKQHEMTSDKARVEALIESLAESYEDPKEILAEYRNNKERRTEIEALVLEEMVSEKISDHATIEKKQCTYQEILNFKSQQDAMDDEEE